MSLRIEWEHSQPLKTTLKYTSDRKWYIKIEKNRFFDDFGANHLRRLGTGPLKDPCPAFSRSWKKDIFFSEWIFSEFKRFSEAGSGPIRSAMKFPFDIDVRIFFNFFKKYFFSIDQKKIENFRKSENFRFFSRFSKKLKIFKENLSWKFSIFEKFHFFEKFRIFFWSIEKIFLKKLKKNPDINIEVKFHCGSNGGTPSLWKPL